MRSPGRRRPGGRWVLHSRKPVFLRARPADPEGGLVSNIPAVASRSSGRLTAARAAQRRYTPSRPARCRCCTRSPTRCRKRTSARACSSGERSPAVIRGSHGALRCPAIRKQVWTLPMLSCTLGRRSTTGQGSGEQGWGGDPVTWWRRYRVSVPCRWQPLQSQKTGSWKAA